MRAEEEESSTISPLPSEDVAANEPKAIMERAKKTHWKSQSVGEVMQSENGVSEELPSFSQNRELWQRRANSQSQISQSASTVGKDLWELRQKHTPDLVMDLPLVKNVESPEAKTGSESPTGPESPDMTTAAERFAKQNQCTLKKNTKGGGSQSRQSSSSSTEGKDDVKVDVPPLQQKPQLKAKPQLMRKPVLTGHHPSPQLIRKDNTQTN